MPRDGGFRLVKWYLDVVAEDGAAAIAYVSELSWRRLALRAASLLVAAPDGQVRERSTLRAADDISVGPEGVGLRCRPLALEGAWHGAVVEEPEDLWAGSTGAVRWTCLLPAAPASLVGPGFSVLGTGYAERLELTLPPWRLPLRQLRWGRFASPEASLVWIDWQGSHAVSLALHGRKRLALDMVSEEAVSAEGGHVTLAVRDKMPLRHGTLGAGPLRRLASLLPRTFLSVDERKWRSRGRLTAGGTTLDGWVIHEVVTWP